MGDDAERTDDDADVERDTDAPEEDTAPDDADMGDARERKEYYLSMIRKIVDDQKELLGERAALKQARRAPLHVNKDGEIVDFYGSGKKALETLRQFTEHQELYLKLVREIVSTFKAFLGEKTALTKARKAPLFIDKDGNVSAYYGNGRNAINILTTQFESVLGDRVAHRKIRSVVQHTVPEAQWDLLPGRIRPEKTETTGAADRTLINWLKQRIDSVVHG